MGTRNGFPSRLEFFTAKARSSPRCEFLLAAGDFFLNHGMHGIHGMKRRFRDFHQILEAGGMAVKGCKDRRGVFVCWINAGVVGVGMV